MQCSEHSTHQSVSICKFESVVGHDCLLGFALTTDNSIFAQPKTLKILTLVLVSQGQFISVGYLETKCTPLCSAQAEDRNTKQRFEGFERRL